MSSVIGHGDYVDVGFFFYHAMPCEKTLKARNASAALPQPEICNFQEGN